MTERKYRIGLDIGIGSVGWAVISHVDRERARIEDFGVRIFESGEIPNKEKRTSQERRGARGSRRVIRRRHWRKERLKQYLLQIGLLSRVELAEAVKYPEQDILSVKVRALSEPVSAKSLFQALLHTCNHRGYRDFYDYDEDEEADAGEQKQNQEAVRRLDRAFRESGCRVISEYILQTYRKDDGTLDFRNHLHKVERLVINRKWMEEETERLLDAQRPFHQALNGMTVQIIRDIIFSQRDFEDGPGNKDDAHRRYTGFLDKLGKCPFYPEEARGFRNTVLADLYAVVNALSQYRYVKSDMTAGLPAPAAKELVQATLRNANLTMTDVKKILKLYGVAVHKSPELKDTALAGAVKFLRPVRKAAEAVGMSWEDLIDGDPLRTDHVLHRLGETLAKYKTPKRRTKELRAILPNDDAFLAKLERIPFSGASAVSYRYMRDAVESFMQGVLYGDFQETRLAEERRRAEETVAARQALLSPDILRNDDDIRDNPVVFRAVNETRKVINAIIRIYGAPECVNVEVGRDLGRSFEERKRLDKKNTDNQKKRDERRKKIAKLLHIQEEEVRETQIERYALYEEQEGRCLYSGKPIDLAQALQTDGAYEIDHIVPYSLILDNSLQNKALVFASENQRKGQRTPLMYLSSDEQKAAFLQRVNAMRDRKANPISAKKYEYLRLETLNSKEARELLENWKSRNLNDMRYISRYIAGYLRQNLLFAGDPRVYMIRGSITSRFRRIWLKDTAWGADEKERETYLNHAADAVVIANLTPAYIEIASDFMKLRQLRRRRDPEEPSYLERAVRKMKNYYGFAEAYTHALLEKAERVPSFVPKLAEEVRIRFNDEDDALFSEQVRFFYRDNPDFLYPPHMPLTSHKPERRFRGVIADAQVIKVREIDGEPHKIARVDIKTLKKSDMDKLYTKDTRLKECLTKIFENQKDAYTIEKYLADRGESAFRLPNGHAVHKVSKDAGVHRNFYQKKISEKNYTMLSMLKYYCIGVYKNTKGKLGCYGIRYVDIVRQDKKLYLKQNILPKDYASHVMYLFKGDYIEITEKGGAIKKGFYQSADTLTRNKINCKINNAVNQNPKSGRLTINREGNIQKKYIDILGHLGGEIRCGAPLSCRPENES